MARKNVKVVVLGDIGRSPRMQYHSLSLADMDYKVDVIGYGDTAPMQQIQLNPLIFYHYMFPVPFIPIKLLNYAFKTVFQAINLLFLLFLTTRSDFLIVQNPPAVPSLLCCWFYTKMIGAKLIIDWHNYAHTIMSLNTSKSHPFVKLTEKIEAIIGRQANHSFCVTKAMKDDLQTRWNILATTLYDRPPSMFKPLTSEDRDNFLVRFGEEHQEIVAAGHLKGDMPGILVSSTSWTEDEDFSMLLSALQDYESYHANGNARKLPKLVCVITGKGPLKEFYLKKIADMKWSHVSIVTPWLEASDYPLLLASADLGVSLHTSSSGLDLPMKVVDMFGCGLPVCAHDFTSLKELVQDNKNGFVFKSSRELSDQIINWFDDFPNNAKQNELAIKFKKNLEQFQALRWNENWQQVAAEIFK